MKRIVYYYGLVGTNQILIIHLLMQKFAIGVCFPQSTCKSEEYRALDSVGNSAPA